jgi:4-hydroxy-tetrahydrodipicolinate reductase
MRLGVVGASGRMGRAVVRLAVADGASIAWAVAAADVGRDVGELAGIAPLGVRVAEGLGAVDVATADVVIDFSAPPVTVALAALLASTRKVALVTGTTGLDEPARQALARAATQVPLLTEPNMSLGVHVLARLVEEAVRALEGFDVEIIETHHGAKVDAPSGTALLLLEAAARARPASKTVHGRQGLPGARPAGEIGVHAVRGGDVIGDHVVHLLGRGERLELTHRATSRDVFAHGALRAARWLAGKPAGAYTLRQVLENKG